MCYWIHVPIRLDSSRRPRLTWYVRAQERARSIVPAYGPCVTRGNSHPINIYYHSAHSYLIYPSIIAKFSLQHTDILNQQVLKAVNSPATTFLSVSGLTFSKISAILIPFARTLPNSSLVHPIYCSNPGQLPKASMITMSAHADVAKLSSIWKHNSTDLHTLRAMVGHYRWRVDCGDFE